MPIQEFSITRPSCVRLFDRVPSRPSLQSTIDCRMPTLRVRGVGLCSGVIVLFLLSAVVIADDWPQWGGPQRDSVWREEGIVETLSAVDPKTGMLSRKWTAKIGS